MITIRRSLSLIKSIDEVVLIGHCLVRFLRLHVRQVGVDLEINDDSSLIVRPLQKKSNSLPFGRMHHVCCMRFGLIPFSFENYTF